MISVSTTPIRTRRQCGGSTAALLDVATSRIAVMVRMRDDFGPLHNAANQDSLAAQNFLEYAAH